MPVLAACGGDSAPQNAGALEEDAGVTEAEAGERTAGHSDAGLGDVGPADAGLTDGGSIPSNGAYVVRRGRDNHYDPCFGSPPGVLFSGMGARGEGTYDAALEFAFEVFGVSYRPGTDISVSSYGALVIGARSSTVGVNVGFPHPTISQPVVAGYWDDFDPRGGFALVDSSTQEFRVTYCDLAQFPDQRTASFEIRLVAGANRIDMEYFQSSTGFTTTVGLGFGAEVATLPCSPNCHFEPFEIVSFLPAGRVEVGPDLEAVGVASMIPTQVLAGAVIDLPDFLVTNRGNVTSAPFIFRVYLGGTDLFYETASDLDQVAGLTGLATEPSKTSIVASHGEALTAPAEPGAYGLFTWLDTAKDDVNRTNNVHIAATFEVVASLPCDITTSSLPMGMAGQPYTAQIEATGCPEPRWMVQPELPGGLSLEETSGRISGTPTSPFAGTYTFTAAQEGYDRAQQVLQLVIQ